MSEATLVAPAQQLRLGIRMAIPALMPGDIIATASNGKNSQGIQWATNSEFSHAILYRGAGMAVDAMPGDGVTRELLPRKLAGASVAAVFRHRTASREQCELAVKWASLQAGTPYDRVGAARVGLQPGARTRRLQFTRTGVLVVVSDELAAVYTAKGHDASFFCSELIIRAYEIAGAPIVDTPAHLTGPGRFMQTNTLAYMGNLQEVG